MHGPADRLDSWKEIATYLSRGVRTVRRWESEEGLPVHRHVHRAQGSVFAFKSEIEAWRSSASRSHAPSSAGALSIAVLPFDNLSANPENAFFADGLTEEVTADLSAVAALHVISRTSAMTFKGSGKDVKTIAGELGVRYVLEGSVRRTGDRLRITAQLIDAGTDEHLWTGKFDGSADEVFEMQERLSRTIVDALRVRLSPEEHRRLAERPIADLHAYECYLRARQEGWRWRKDSIDRAVHLLRTGLDIIGDNARLHAALGLAFLQYREAGVDVSDAPIEEAERCAARVFAAEPASAEGMQLRGWINYARGRIQEAVADLKVALERDPRSADTLLLLTNCYLISGRVANARPLIARLIAVDPLTPVSRCMPAFADAMEGNWEAALGPYRRMFDMDPDNPMARLFYVWVLAANRHVEPARDLIRSAPAESRDSAPMRLATLLADAAAGNPHETARQVNGALEAAAGGADVFPRLLAEAYALAGIEDRAVHWLSVAVDRGFINYPFLARHDPFFAGMQNAPAFVALLQSVRERWERFEP